MNVVTARLAFDAQLPARDALLDPPTMAERFTAELGLCRDDELTDCVLQRAKYRIGESLRVVYDLRVSGRPYTLAARMFGPGSSMGSFDRAQINTTPVASLPGVMHDPAWNTVWWTLPNDRKIRHLALLLEPSKLAGTAGLNVSSTQLMAWAPEKTASARWMDSSGATIGFAKVFADHGAASEVARLTKALSQQRMVAPAPRLISYASEANLVVVAPAEGTVLAEVANERLARPLGMLGTTLAQVHRLVPVRNERFDRLSQSRIGTAAALIAQARPDVAATCQRVAAALMQRPNDTHRDVFLHGDVHFRNFLVAERRGVVTPIDFDQSGIGSPALDIGSLLARLRSGVLLGEFSPALEVELTSEFCGAYTRIAPLPDADVIRWHVAAALLVERALRSVNRVHGEGLAHLADVVGEADRILTEGSL